VDYQMHEEFDLQQQPRTDQPILLYLRQRFQVSLQKLAQSVMQQS
jgi:hypothetical protein